MPHLLLRELPKYECLLEAATEYPSLDPSAVEVYLHLLRASDLLAAYTTDHLQTHGLAQGRFTVLMLLNRTEEGKSSPAELADKAAVTRATMTGLLDTMERDGLVSRTVSTTDRRAIEVCLTPEGQKLIGNVWPGYFARIAQLIQPLQANERKSIVTKLLTLQKTAAELAPEAFSGKT